MRIKLPPLAAFVVGLALFGLAMRASSGFSRLGWTEGEFADGVCFKAILTALALALMLADRRPLREFGFCRPRSRWHDWVIGPSLGTISGMIGSAAIILSPARGMTFIQNQAFWQMIVGVWFVSTIAEEIFTRGLIQTWMRDRSEGGIRIGPLHLSWPVIASGLLFGSLHFSILMRGADWWTVSIIVGFTTCLGLVAAFYRQKTSSLALPILIHLLGNIGGFIGGGITMIILMMLGKGSALPGG
jgi:membrane protease YdiL (CAAX protease family)